MCNFVITDNGKFCWRTEITESMSHGKTYHAEDYEWGKWSIPHKEWRTGNILEYLEYYEHIEESEL